MESVVEAVAAYLGVSADIVKPLNFYTKGQTTPYGQPLPYFRYPNPTYSVCQHDFSLFKLSLNSIWDQLKSSSNYDARKAQVETYNRNNRWTKRGISLVPLKYGIAWAGAKYACSFKLFWP